MVKHVGPPFRLFDLPGELRTKIYDEMVFRDYIIHLDGMVAPLITATNKQVRAESIASFFALNAFLITVETNICLSGKMQSFVWRYGSSHTARQRADDAHRRHCIDYIYQTEPDAGHMRLGPDTAAWLEKIPPEVACFLNVGVVIQDTVSYPMYCAIDLEPAYPGTLYSAWHIMHWGYPGRIKPVIGLAHDTELVPHVLFFGRRHVGLQDCITDGLENSSGTSSMQKMRAFIASI